MTDSAPVIDGARPICLACIHDHTDTAAQRNRRDQVRAGAASELQGKPRKLDTAKKLAGSQPEATTAAALAAGQAGDLVISTRRLT